MKRRSVIVLGIIASLSTHGVHGQEPEPVPRALFRAGVEAVEVTVYVTDEAGNPVTDLTADDFEVLEDGVPQSIGAFALVNIPVERFERPLFAASEIAPDVGTNQGPEGRLYVIAIDELPPAQELRIRRLLRTFIEREFGANDVGALVYLGRARSGQAQAFTSRRRLLLDAVDQITGGFDNTPPPVPERPEQAAGEELLGQLSLDQERDRQVSWPMRARMRALRDLVESVAAIRGRQKALLFVTTGIDMDVFEALDYSGGSKSVAFDDLHRTIATATRGSVAFYPINPAGVPASDATSETEGGALFSPLQTSLELRALAEATGGFGILDTNDFIDPFRRLVRENSTYYLLGFSSSNRSRGGRFRELEVRVRRPGLDVRTRSGYLEPRDRAPEVAPVAGLPLAIADALASPLADPTVPLRVSAVPYRGADRQVRIAISLEMEAAGFGLVEREGRFVGDVAMATTAVAADGRTHLGQRFQAGLALRPDTHVAARESGIRVLSQMELPAGQYQLRAAGGTPTRAGSVVYDLEAPDFFDAPLAMSGVGISAASVANALTIRQLDSLGSLLPGSLTATRDFPVGDTLSLYVEVYDNRTNVAAHSVDVSVELRSDAGQLLSVTTQRRSSTELEGRTGGYGIGTEVPLDVEPGLYVIHVQARANIGVRPVVSRDVVIRVH